ncbi:MAG: DUF3443 family protein [Thiomonas sp.]|uniref:DUF3443 family protein n=1 Tax=Thiomonas sp. TaxID=2047785 RepID=UPI002A371A77|nr:DUF3443 family protein [Thiomonas sp.]MDY0329531.1 DUF3443 family protein [Thiomonas sp.]
MTATLVGCGGGSASVSLPPKSVANQVPVTVEMFNPQNPFPNRPYVTVTVCNDQNDCQVIDHVLLDTGSTGLRLMPGILNIALPSQKDANGNPIGECMQYGAGYFWGAQRIATVKMAGEVAANIPITVAGATDIPSAAPQGCAQLMPNAISGLAEFKGILGIGPQKTDCGSSCEQDTKQQMYFSCTGDSAGACVSILMPVSQQTPNPIASFSSDNNGSVLVFPGVNAPQDKSIGSLIFGIGTQNNNQINGLQIYRSSVPNQDFPMLAASVNGAASFAFLDTGTNAYSLAQTGTVTIPGRIPYLQAISGVTVCGEAGGPYCPPQPVSLQIRLNGANGNPTSWQTINLADPTPAFQQNFAVIPALGFQSSISPGMTILGLPFYFGRTVATAIDGAQTSYGLGPFWAF